MTKEVLSALGAAARGLLRDWRALLALAALYAALVASCGLFVTTREATAWQLLLTAALAVAAPLLLFVLLAACAHYAAGERRALPLVAGALKGFWKAAVLVLPVVALVVLCVWGMNKLEAKVRHDPRAEAQETFAAEGGEAEEGETESGAAKKRPVRWKYVFVSALRLLLLGVLLPLLGLHLLLAAAREGFGASLRRLGRTLARAYAPRSVFTYAVGMIVFALLPYFLITVRTPASAGWLELSLLSVRLGLAFLLTLGGALITMTALARADDGGGGQTLPATPPPPPPAAPRAEETVGAGA